MGSGDAEREAAYRLDERAYGHSVTREQRWYAGEPKAATVELGAYAITPTPITNGHYAAFVATALALVASSALLSGTALRRLP